MAEDTETAASKRPNGDWNPLGQRLRELRHEHGLTLRGLADHAGVTASLLSQVETGQANPSVDTLYAVAQALGIPATCFFETAEQHARHGQPSEPEAVSPVVWRTDRRSIQLANGVVWQSLLPAEEPDFEFCEVVYPPGSYSAEVMEQHGGMHCLVVLEGALTVQLIFTTHQLQAGDSIAFDASMPHQLRNEGDQQVRAVLTLLQRPRGGASHHHPDRGPAGSPR